MAPDVFVFESPLNKRSTAEGVRLNLGRALGSNFLAFMKLTT